MSAGRRCGTAKAKGSPVVQGRVGMVCYPTSGGSGIVATELGLSLARRGWEVHFITYALPVRLKGFEENVFFHEVQTANYPVLHHPPYTLSLAVKITEVAETHGLDLVHVHYAIPHAVCAYLARRMMLPGALPVITTLHGTDITLVGVQPSFHKITRFSIEQSDRVTAVSEFLRRKTVELFAVEVPIRVIPNFVDPELFHPEKGGHPAFPFLDPGEKTVMHASNFRPVKRVDIVVRTFARLAAEVPSRLVLVGDGPERWQAQELARSLGVEDRVFFLGIQERMETLLPLADLFLLPSEHESFGLVALEAMACGVPVIATSRGGTNELVEDGVSGFLVDPDDGEAMVATARRVLDDGALALRVGEAARRRAVECFSESAVVDRYEALYRELLRSPVPAVPPMGGVSS
jgi:N-acetyl-alpha-D-glucosaminyl L-malate synthase BshA